MLQQITNLDKRLTALEKLTLLQQQTEMFWNLQLQFFEMNDIQLITTFAAYWASDNYVYNKHSNKVLDIHNGFIDHPFLPYWEHECLATHLALQLSGLGDD